MGIETNYKYMIEEYEAEKCELLTKYIAKLKEQIDYDKNILEDKACCISADGNYDEIGKCCMK